MPVWGVLLALPTLAAVLHAYFFAESEEDGWRRAVGYVQGHLRLPERGVVFPGYLESAVSYYYKPGGHEPQTGAEVPKQDVKTIPSLRTEGFGENELNAALEEAVKCHERAWLITSPPREEQEDPEHKVREWFQ